MAEGERPDDDDLVDEPSPRKLAEAEREGQVALSHTAVLAAALVGGIGALSFLAPMIGRGLIVSLRVSAEALASLDALPNASASIGSAMGASVAALASIAVAATLAIVATLAQTRAGIWPGLLAPRADRLFSMSRLTHLFSGEGLADLGIAALKTTLLLGIAYVTVWPALRQATRLFSVEDVAALIDGMAGPLFYAAPRLLLGLCALAAVDIFVVRRRFFQKMRSTTAEMKREHKEEEGDPLVKGRRRRRHRELAQGRIAVEVPRADALVVNPTHIAVAIRYRRKSDRAPRVTAKAKGSQAQRMRELAVQNGIPVLQDIPLARFLHKKVKVGREVPAETYKAVAAVLAFVARVTGRPPGTGRD